MRAKVKAGFWVAALFTALYFCFAAFVPIHADWLSGAVRAILLLIAVASSLLLWLSYTIWVRKSSQDLLRLVLIGIGLPIVLAGVPAAISSYQSHRLLSLDAKMKQEGKLLDMADEELLTVRGNAIGVRLRYLVRYPTGAALLLSHVPPAKLSSAPSPYSGGFWVQSAGYKALNTTDYMMTSDVVPDFMPAVLRFGTGDFCFNWAGTYRQEAIANAVPQTFRVYLGDPQYSAQTRKSYDLRRFYEGALKEGARECPANAK